MTPEEFQSSETHRTELAILLKNPILKDAFAALKSELEPSSGNNAVGNPVVGASRFQQIAGANHIINGLDGLTKPYTKPKKLVGKTLRHEDTPELT